MFQDNRDDIIGGNAPDISQERLARLRERIEAVAFAAELLDIEAQVAAPTVFDRQLESVGRCYIDNGEGKPVIALNPGFSDDKIASFYVHEMAHLRQMCLADDVYVAHPMSMCELLLMAMFVKEADAYMRQALFARQAFMQGDHGVLEDLTQKPAGELSKEEFLNPLDARLSPFAAEDIINRQFWVTMKQLTGAPSLARGYFNDAISALHAGKERFKTMSFEHLRDVDVLPLLAPEDIFQRLKPMATFSAKEREVELDYFRRENAPGFFDRFFSMLPTPLQKDFHAEKISFIQAFYGAMEKARAKASPDGGQTPKIWLPGR